ncbi:hypothetical protein ACFVHB_10020 [Kitasatospora sp. NPDC127111]|uniref:hypothetical protein n=1 Tax=Kitasatospora sp. NPDC127111 TaxID=3345363 RepID=UPI0036444FA8
MIAALIWLLGLLVEGLRRLTHPKIDRVQGMDGTEDIEQQLSAALLAGRIGQAEYQHSLETLARDDEFRRPLDVPPS